MVKAGSIGTFALVMLITGAIDSIRNLPATAMFGSSLIFFFIFSAIVFLIPAGLVSAELSASSSEKGGIFHWVHKAFGERTAFLAIWLQWINTMVWFPTVLSFLAGTAAYFINPALAENKLYLIGVILSSYWFLTFINMKGIEFSARFSSFCAVVGIMVPMILIILLAAFWIVKGNPLQIHFTAETMVPTFKSTDSWISLTAIMAAFLGMELATVHIKHVKNPLKTFPKALFLSTIIILLTMTLGSLAIAVVLPKDQINLVNGVMQAFADFFARYHLAWITPIITGMLLLGTLGGIISWVISPAKGLLHAAQLNFLPRFLTKQNKHNVPTNLLLMQGLLVSLICLAFLFMPSVNGSYWLLTALSTQLYMLMYVIMFLAAIVLKPANQSKQSDIFAIPGGKLGTALVGGLGLIGCLITLYVGFIPPAGINVGSAIHYELIFCGGLIAMVAPISIFYLYQNRNRAEAIPAETNKVSMILEDS